MKCVCRTCHSKKHPDEMLIHSITKLPTSVCLRCVVEKRAATRLTNSPRAPLMDVPLETGLNVQVRRLVDYYKSMGRIVQNVLMERGADGMELVIKYVQTQTGEHRIHC